MHKGAGRHHHDVNTAPFSPECQYSTVQLIHHVSSLRGARRGHNVLLHLPGCIPFPAENRQPSTQTERKGGVNMVASGAQATRSSPARYCLLDKWQRENALDTYEATFLERQTSSPPRFPRFSNPRLRRPENDACLECDQQRGELSMRLIYAFFFFPSLLLSISTIIRCKILSLLPSLSSLISVRSSDSKDSLRYT